MLSCHSPQNSFGLSLALSAFCVTLFLYNSPVAADTTPSSISIEQALDIALSNNPELAAAEREIGIAEGARKQAGVIPNPELSWSVEDTRSDSRITSVQVTQPIELGGKRGARIGVSEREQDAAAIEFERRKNALRADVIQAFYSALNAQEGLVLANKSLELANRGVQVAEGRVKAGQVSPVEIARAQVQRSEAKLDFNRAMTSSRLAYKRLALVTGSQSVMFDHVAGSPDSLPTIPNKPDLLNRISQTVEVRLANKRVERDDSAIDLEKAQRIPNIDVSVGSQYDAGLRERVNLVGLSIPLPLFDRNQGNILSASRRADQARDNRNATELRLYSEAQQAFEQWDNARNEIDSIRDDLLPVAQRTVESAVRGFEMGKFAFIDVLDAQRTLVSMRVKYLTTLDEAVSAWVVLERIYGVQLEARVEK